MTAMAAEPPQIPLDELFPPDWQNSVPPENWPDLTAEMPAERDPRALLETELAELERRIEENAIEMNTADGLRLLDDLELERDFLVSELDALDGLAVAPDQPIRAPSRPEPDNSLVDARFMVQSDLDTEGHVTGYTVQAIALYEALDGTLNGSVLDVAQFAEQGKAIESYQALQESIDTGVVTLAEVLPLAEAMAEENGLPAQAWRAMDNRDQANYEFHAAQPDILERDTPSSEAVADLDFAARLFAETLIDPEHTAQLQASLTNEQARAALHEIGLEMPHDFDLNRDTFLDVEAGVRVINGIFQADPNEPSGGYAPLFVSLKPGSDDPGFEAQAIEYGHSGALAEVQKDYAQIQEALGKGGLAQALEAMQALDALRLEPAAEPPEGKSWSRDID